MRSAVDSTEVLCEVGTTTPNVLEVAQALQPGSAARVLEPHTRVRQQSGTRLAELVSEPAHRERAGRHGMLPDTLHFEG